MNPRKIVFSVALILNALAATSQTSVYLTQTNSKSDEFQVVIVDSEGKQITAATPAFSVRNFSEGLASIQTMDKKFGFIDLEGNLVIPARFAAVGFFIDNLAWAREENGKIGFIDRSGSWAVQPEYDVVKPFEIMSGMARVRKDGQWFYVNHTGQPLIVESDAYWDFSEGLAQGEKNGLRGFFNNEGKWVIEPKFEDAKKFMNGQAAVKVNGKWGIIDQAENWIVEAKFDVIKVAEHLE